MTEEDITSYTFFHIFKVVESSNEHPHFQVGKFFNRIYLDDEFIALVPLDPEDDQVVRKYKKEHLTDNSLISISGTILKNGYQFYKEKQ